MRGRATEELDQPSALGIVERGKDFLLERLGLRRRRGQQRVSRLGQVDRVSASICRMHAPLYQTLLFELIDEADHRIAVHSQQVGEFLLTAPVAPRQMGQDPEVGRLDPERDEPLGEPVRNVMTELRQQEGTTIVQ